MICLGLWSSLVISFHHPASCPFKIFIVFLNFGVVWGMGFHVDSRGDGDHEGMGIQVVGKIDLPPFQNVFPNLKFSSFEKERINLILV